mmetsp:Transcript_43469/g.94679  ORF Transcript_43469/g.94679 Transcript_43469/m.94679 type:complete len:103 (-) Transcript_43469:252-560(-)
MLNPERKRWRWRQTRFRSTVLQIPSSTSAKIASPGNTTRWDRVQLIHRVQAHGKTTLGEEDSDVDLPTHSSPAPVELPTLAVPSPLHRGYRDWRFGSDWNCS